MWTKDPRTMMTLLFHNPHKKQRLRWRCWHQRVCHKLKTKECLAKNCPVGPGTLWLNLQNWVLCSWWECHKLDASSPAAATKCSVILVDIKDLTDGNENHLDNLWNCLREDGWLFIFAKMRDLVALGPETFSKITTIFVFGSAHFFSNLWRMFNFPFGLHRSNCELVVCVFGRGDKKGFFSNLEKPQRVVLCGRILVGSPFYLTLFFMIAFYFAWNKGFCSWITVQSTTLY